MSEHRREARAHSGASIDEGELDRLRAVLEDRPDVAFAYLYGSATGGDRHGRSDLDVAVFLDPQLPNDAGASERLRLLTDLQASLQQAVPGEDIDLIPLDRAPPLLADRVLRNGRLLTSRDETLRVRWMAQVKSRFCDLSPLRAQLDRALDRRIRAGRFGRGAESQSG